MKAIVPLNIAALRVSSEDTTNVTPGFAGRTVAFDQLPHGSGSDASTGDRIWRSLITSTPDPPLGAGIHLHWELPEYFKRGRQDPGTGAITFPPAPTRWLVVRSLSTDTSGAGYGAPRHASWVVESDYLATALHPDRYNIVRPAATVPLTAPGTTTPYMYMGRVVEAASWDPASEHPEDYLPHYTGPGGTPLYLTAVGFAGAAFSSYYPDCCSVFGFWDTFADLSDVFDTVANRGSGTFRVSYQVIGWLPDAATDPLATLAATVTSQYDQYLAQCAEQQVQPVSKPTDVFARVTADQFAWQFSGNAISYTLGPGDILSIADEIIE